MVEKVTISLAFFFNLTPSSIRFSEILDIFAKTNNFAAMTQIVVTLENNADENFLRRMIENMKGVVKTSLSHSETDDIPAERNATLETLHAIKAEIDPSLIDLTEAKGTSVVYLSAILASKYAETCKRLEEILSKHNVKYAFLQGTKDIWCRDYMPVQTPGGKLIQFKYDPSYLKDPQYSDSRSDVEHVDAANNITPIFSDIILDGGNVVMHENKAIITDRVFSENPDRDREKLISELSALLECEIIIIPAYKPEYDFTGHADGMIRFVDSNTVLVNDLDQDFKYMKDSITKALNKANLRYINFPWFEHKIKGNNDHAIGIYLNYLEVDDLIVMPVFGVPGNKDAEALAKLKEVFPNKVVETIDYNDIALTGGILNCTTWVVKEK